MALSLPIRGKTLCACELAGVSSPADLFDHLVGAAGQKLPRLVMRLRRIYAPVWFEKHRWR
jgi:hypothetical protein